METGTGEEGAGEPQSVGQQGETRDERHGTIQAFTVGSGVGRLGGGGDLEKGL